MDFYGMTGERLGTIGDPSKTAADLPQWKQDFLSKPSLSVRKGISWSYKPPFEDTSTLVLTSLSGSFVDIRFPLRPTPDQPITNHPSFWAFTGTSTTTFDPVDAPGIVPMSYSAHSTWKHDIDSKGDGITDEGDMFVLPNGDCMEVGMMENPETGKVEMYKEYWTGPTSEPGSGGVKKMPCVVAKGVGTGGGHGRGLIIRIGDHCQGIAQMERGAEMLAERWVKIPVDQNPMRSEEQGDGASWLKDWRSNTASEEQVELAIPCMWVCGEGRELGDQHLTKGVKWTITELAT